MTTLSLSAGVTGLVWAGDVALFALGSGEVAAVSPDDTALAYAVHDGAILSACAAPDGAAMITGGDDGLLQRVRPDGAVETLWDTGGKWIDAVVASPTSGVIVAAAGKQAHVFKAGQTGAPSHSFAHPSAVGGLSLDAKGRRLAVSHYGGATLRYVLMADDAGVALKWAGSHLACALHPDGDFLVTAMQEIGLHAWRVADKKDLRMSGYAAKTRSFSWDRRARMLATSGADCAVVWPFMGKDGPMGKAPALIGERLERLVTQVAFHPRLDHIAIGYDDGAVHLAKLEGPPTLELRGPTGAAVTGLAWSPSGSRVAAGDDQGEALVLDTPL